MECGQIVRTSFFAVKCPTFEKQTTFVCYVIRNTMMIFVSISLQIQKLCYNFSYEKLFTKSILL